MRSEKFLNESLLGETEYSSFLVIINSNAKKATDGTEVTNGKMTVEIQDEMCIEFCRVGCGCSIIHMDG